MAVLFIRKPSETPNIQNIDDIRMVRYAYGNQNGYIKGYGAELSHNATGSTFLINSGIFVIQGAEVRIDANGWSESVSGVTNKRYYTVYGEVNLALQTAEIKSTYSHANYPTVEAGDDLTQSTDGTARVELYRFTATNAIIADVVKVVKAINYLSDFKTELSDGSFIVKNAENVTTYINGKAINNIFEIDGITAKKASTAVDQPQGDNSTKIANTKYVDAAKAAAISSANNYTNSAISNFYGSAALNVSPSLSASTNIIKRQGNLVQIRYYYEVSSAQYEHTYTFTIPAKATSGNANLNLRPTTTQKIHYRIKQVSGYPSTESWGSWQAADVSSGGIFTATVGSYNRFAGIEVYGSYEIT